MLYVNDFCSDGIVEAMTTEEVGAYFLLLCKAWLEDQVGTVPDDDKILARWSRLGPRQWEKCKPAVLAAFKKRADGRWHQGRMQREYDNWLESKKKKQQAGSKGGSTTQAKLRANGQAKSSISTSTSTSIASSNSSSGSDVDVDGASNLSFSENARANANRLAGLIPCSEPDARSLVAKVSVLWDDGTICDDAVEQAIESFSASEKRIGNPAGWFYRCMANQCEQRGQNFEQLLKTTALPVGVLAPAR